MSRKLVAGAASLLLVTVLLTGSAAAKTVRPARGDGSLQRIAPTAVPFTRAKAASSAAKPERSKAVAGSRPGIGYKGKVEAVLAEQVAAAGDKSQVFNVLVATRAAPDSLRSAVRGMQVTRTFSAAFSGFAARVTAEQIRALQALPQVEAISLDKVVTANIDSAEKWTGVTKAREDFGLTGNRDGYPQQYSTEDVVIAIIDTGIDTGHKDLAGKVVGWADMINDLPWEYDDHGHGTHVAGIAAGAGAANRSMRGVAPGAALVGVKVLDEHGSGTFSSVIGGIDWVIEHKDEYNIRVLKTDRFEVLPTARG